jgi:serine phosphatase RsbU (regulator of sigma subunit)
MEETANAHRAVGSKDSGTVEELILPLGTVHGTVARARRFVAQQFARHGLVEVADDAELIAGELVTNALLHAGPPAELVLQLSPRRARLEVRDSSPLPPVRPRPNVDAMTGRGLYFVEALAREWGVTTLASGKAVWAEFEVGADTKQLAGPDESTLDAVWAVGELEHVAQSTEKIFTVRLGDVPTDLLLSAKAHVDNLVREFTLMAAGSRSGATAAIPTAVAELIETVVNRFAEPRQAIKRQALVAAAAGKDHVRLELELPASAATAGEQYLHALDQADAYCRAARLLTLESPPQHRVFRRWYVGELVGQLRAAAAGQPVVPGETFERRLLREIGVVATAERAANRANRLHALTVALAAAATPEAVANAVLREGVAALGAAGGGMLLATDNLTLAVPGTVGYDEQIVARLRAESHDAELPAAVAMRTGEPVWLESRGARDEAFSALVDLEPETVSMCAVPLIVDERRLGALRFSFTEARLFDAEERNFVQAMAAQTAQALDRANLHRQRVEVAQRLQRSLLPPELPSLPGMTVRAAYQSVTEEMDVGGDFYDVWPCGSHRWAVAIGDVCGTGPEAAVVTAVVRHTLRAFTMTSTDIETILRHLDRALADTAIQQPNERFSTVLFGVLTITSNDVRLELASGGHPGPVIVRADGTTEILELTGSLLGVLPEVTIDRRHIHLDPGDQIVLVTDGATEARSGKALFGIEGVAAAAADAHARGKDTAAAVEKAVRDYCDGNLHDDLAVLVLRRDAQEQRRRRRSGVRRRGR